MTAAPDLLSGTPVQFESRWEGGISVRGGAITATTFIVVGTCLLEKAVNSSKGCSVLARYFSRKLDRLGPLSQSVYPEPGRAPE